MNLLKRIFRSYNAENGKTLSDWRKRMLAVDENYAFLLQARDNENEQRKNKRAVRVTRTDRQTGKQVTYNAGILAVRDHGSPQEKLRKAFGGKTMRRILKAERRAARENPDALVVHALDAEDNKHALTRGVDFVMIPRAHGGPTLVLHDLAQAREPLYREVADLVLDTDGLSPGLATSTLAQLLATQWQRSEATA